jgi:uncharacterized SAM-binding protein YcdF (DUF218 family)
MFFFLSKTLGYVMRPLVIICASLVASWLIRNPRWKKRFFLLGTIMLLFFSNEFVMNEVMRWWEVKVTPLKEIRHTYEYGVLLCGVAKSEVEPKDRVYVGSGADRINHTLLLYKSGYIRKILISGGSGTLIDNGFREADELSSLLRLMGVMPEDILVENASRNTHESALEAKRILEPITTPQQCILITSANHMRRSAACFANAGWPMDQFSTDFLSHPRRFTFDVLFIPKMDALGSWNVLIKEWTGYTAYWFAGYI